MTDSHWNKAFSPPLTDCTTCKDIITLLHNGLIHVLHMRLSYSCWTVTIYQCQRKPKWAPPRLSPRTTEIDTKFSDDVFLVVTVSPNRPFSLVTFDKFLSMCFFIYVALSGVARLWHRQLRPFTTTMRPFYPRIPPLVGGSRLVCACSAFINRLRKLTHKHSSTHIASDASDGEEIST